VNAGGKGRRAVLPLLYLHGLSSLDFVPALEGSFSAAAGPSASVITLVERAARPAAGGAA
jgi:hypothetical protein